MTARVLLELPRIAVSLMPVLLFLLALIVIDSYKLVKLRAIFISILAGGVAAALAMLVNTASLAEAGVALEHYSRYIAPIVEELLKAIYLAYLIRSRRVGFLVDAAIHGFAIGTGFALLENVYYLNAVNSDNILLWMVRGFGTAIMHGGATAVFGLVSKNAFDRYSSNGLAPFLPGLLLVMGIHSFFNHFFLPPLQTTVMLLVAFPLILVLAFHRSEKSTRAWLGFGFDADQEMLQLITTGQFTESPIGTYLQAMKAHFPGEVVADMLCLLRLQVEVAIRAKGILLMRESGFATKVDPEIQEKFTEMAYLEKHIGKTGMLAIAPVLHKESRERWQRELLG